MRTHPLQSLTVAVAGCSAAFLLAAAPVQATTAPSGGATAQQAISFLNAQRAANGLPAGIVENPDWSRGCQLHFNYTLRNGSDPGNPHDEDPSKPGYTPEGQAAAQNSVLGARFQQDGTNGWEDAPIHLMQLLGPGLSVTGYSTGCMWTWPGYQRPVPAQTKLYTYPGDGGHIYAQEETFESPYSPGELLGLPQEATIGPYLMVFAFGQNVHAVHLTSASLTGPDGPQQILTADNYTSGPQGSLAGYLPPGGMIIPKAPLRADSAYTATASGQGDNGEPLTWSWHFRTNAKVVKTPRIRWGRTVTHRRSVDLHIIAGPAADQRVKVALRRSRRVTHKTLLLRPGSTTLRVQHGTVVTLSVPSFTIGNQAYAATTLKRVVH